MLCSIYGRIDTQLFLLELGKVYTLQSLNPYMEIFSQTTNDFYFLRDGGEMGQLTRDRNWSETSLGPPENWPQNLRTTVDIVLNSAFPMFLFWGKDLLCFYNDAFRPSLGIKGKHPAIGKKGADVWEEIWVTVGPLINGVIESGKPVWFENQLIPIYRNGTTEEVYWTFSYSAVHNNNGKVSGVLVTVIETTENKKLYNAIWENEKRYVAISDNIPNLAWMADVNGYIFWYNKKWYDYTGATPDQMAGWGWQSVHHPDMLEKVLIKWRNSIATGKPFEMVFPLKGANGEYKQFLTRVAPVRNDEGIIQHWFGTNTDITTRFLAEENLRNVIIQAPVAMALLMGPTYVVELANERMFSLWGRPAEILVSKPIFEALPEAKGQGFDALLDEVFTTGKSFSAVGVSIVLPRADKMETVYVDFTYEPYRDNNEIVTGILIVAVDVTAQVLARNKIEDIVKDRTKALAIANEALQKSNDELAQFAFIASHDLQEPIRKICTFSNLLGNRIKEKLDEDSKKYLSKINSSSLRMRALVQDVLDYSQLINPNVGFVEVDLNSVMDNVLSDYDLLIEEKNASIIIQNELPKVQAVPHQMRQLFENLLSNALKFSKKHIKSEISISTFKPLKEELKQMSLPLENNYCKIQFSDNGIGFDTVYSEQIFNIFSKLHHGFEYEGTGIGLAMCKKIVLNHKGYISAKESTVEGAVFTILLPIKQRLNI